MSTFKENALFWFGFFFLAFSAATQAASSAMITYVQGGKQETWFAKTNETLSILEQRLALCNEDLKHFSFFGQLVRRTGVSIIATSKPNWEMDTFFHESERDKEIWVTFFDPEDKWNLRITSNFSYLTGTKTIFAPLTEVSREWFCSRLVHEFGHAKHHLLLKSASSEAVMNTPLWISEEVEAHEYERAALDHYTDGKYTETMVAILDKYNPESQEQLFESMKYEDFMQLDNLFTKDITQLERGIRGPTFLINISILLAERLNQDPVGFYAGVTKFIHDR